MLITQYKIDSMEELDKVIDKEPCLETQVYKMFKELKEENMELRTELGKQADIKQEAIQYARSLLTEHDILRREGLEGLDEERFYYGLVSLLAVLEERHEVIERPYI